MSDTFGYAPGRSTVRTTPRGGSPPTASTGLLGLRTPADAGLDELVDLAVEDGTGVAGLVLGPEVLDHLVRVQHVGAHLVAPRPGVVAFERVHLGALLLPAPLQEP